MRARDELLKCTHDMVNVLLNVSDDFCQDWLMSLHCVSLCCRRVTQVQWRCGRHATEFQTYWCHCIVCHCVAEELLKRTGSVVDMLLNVSDDVCQDWLISLPCVSLCCRRVTQVHWRRGGRAPGRVGRAVPRLGLLRAGSGHAGSRAANWVSVLCFIALLPSFLSGMHLCAHGSHVDVPTDRCAHGPVCPWPMH